MSDKDDLELNPDLVGSCGNAIDMGEEINLPVSLYHDGKPWMMLNPNDNTITIFGTVYPMAFFENQTPKRLYETLLDFTPSVGGVALQDYGRYNDVMVQCAAIFPMEYIPKDDRYVGEQRGVVDDEDNLV